MKVGDRVFVKSLKQHGEIIHGPYRAKGIDAFLVRLDFGVNTGCGVAYDISFSWGQLEPTKIVWKGQHYTVEFENDEVLCHYAGQTLRFKGTVEQARLLAKFIGVDDCESR